MHYAEPDILRLHNTTVFRLRFLDFVIQRGYFDEILQSRF